MLEKEFHFIWEKCRLNRVHVQVQNQVSLKLYSYYLPLILKKCVI